MRKDATQQKRISSRGGNRTRTPLSEPRILSPVRLPISPLGQVVAKLFDFADEQAPVELLQRQDINVTFLCRRLAPEEPMAEDF